VQLPVRPLDTRAPRHPSGERRRLCCSAPRPAAALRVSPRVVTARPLPAETGSWTLHSQAPCGCLYLAPPSPCTRGQQLPAQRPPAARRPPNTRGREGFVLSGAAAERRPAPHLFCRGGWVG